MFARTTRCTVCALALAALLPPPADAQDLSSTAIIYVHGFDYDGPDRRGVFGEDRPSAIADSVAARAAGSAIPAIVTGTTYYGDVPPSYYTDVDQYELERITWEWGGGVPRYAYIVARHAREVMERSGARSVSFVSASFGSLVVRFLIENNLAGLAAEKKIARWLSIEGVVAGNWAASHHEFVKLLDAFGSSPVDILHMSYDWIETHMGRPRAEASSPYYASILMGQVASTDDGGPGAALRSAMLLYNDYRPNDQVQALPDALFLNTRPEARFAGRTPTRAVFHVTHRGIQNERGAWAEAATFLTGTRRVTITMTSARVQTLPESRLWFWNWMPAEVLFESWVFSPAAEARWGPIGPLCAFVKEGASAPIRRYWNSGETQQFEHVVFDDMVLPEETELVVRLWANELDYDPRYGVFETARTPHHDDMGGGWVLVSARESGTYSFATPDWSCALTVNVFEYPAPKPLVGLPRGALAAALERTTLLIAPNPSYSTVRIVAPSLAAEAGRDLATLEVMDLSGRLVRRIDGSPGEAFEWDGLDGSGRSVGAGMYFYRVVTPRGSWSGRGFLLR